MTIEAEETRERERKRAHYVLPQPDTVAGGKDMQACGRCGMPLPVAGLLWDEMYGTIQAGIGGRRVALIPAFILASLERLGDGQAGTGGVIEEAVFDSVRSSLEKGFDDFYESAADIQRGAESGEIRYRMNMRGWGAVTSCTMRKKDWRLEVLNPVSDTLVAGWLRALYTVAIGEEPRVVISGEPQQKAYELG